MRGWCPVLRIIRYGLSVTAAVLVLLLAVVLTAPRWLGPVLAALLPPGWQLDELAVVTEAWPLPKILRLSVSTDGCRLLALDDGRIAVRWKGPRPQLEAVEIAALTITPACLRAASAAAESSGLPTHWLAAVPGGARLVVDRLTVTGWLAEPHRVELAAASDAIRAAADGPALHLDGQWTLATGEGEFRAGLPHAGPVTGLGVLGRLRMSSDPTAGLDVTATLEGAVPATGSRLDGEVAGRWQPAGVTLDTLRLDLDSLTTPVFTATRARLVLREPARLDAASLRVAAVVAVGMERVNVVDSGRLDQPAVTLQLTGDPAGVVWTAEGRAGGGVGPITGEGKWSESGLDGRLTLDRQPLPPLQGLLPPTVPVELTGGTAAAELKFAWSPGAAGDVGLEGELKVADGRLGGTHWAAEQVTVRLPFRYASGSWQLGARQAGQVTAGRITAAVPAESLSARVAGAWPWSARAPLRLEGLRLRLLGGEATLDALRLPQGGRAVTLRLRGIELEQLSALYGDEVVSLGGAVDADLPLHLDHGSLLIDDGTVRNATPVRLRLTDAEAIAAFKANNPNLAQAADWLSDLHVDRLEGRVNLNRDGALVLVATIEGRNPQRGDRSVRLNYRHEENLLHLLQSLRIGSDLSRGIEQRLSPARRRR